MSSDTPKLRKKVTKEKAFVKSSKKVKQNVLISKTKAREKGKVRRG